MLGVEVNGCDLGRREQGPLDDQVADPADAENGDTVPRVI